LSAIVPHVLAAVGVKEEDKDEQEVEKKDVYPSLVNPYLLKNVK
jgi:hypothetical protein